MTTSPTRIGSGFWSAGTETYCKLPNNKATVILEFSVRSFTRDHFLMVVASQESSWTMVSSPLAVVVACQ